MSTKKLSDQDQEIAAPEELRTENELIRGSEFDKYDEFFLK